MVFDLIVIGNGALGLSIAHRLKSRAPEMRLAVVGPVLRDGGATPAAGAMLNAWGELVRNQFDHPILATRAGLMLDALPLWNEFADELRAFAPALPAPGWGTLVLETGRGGASETETLATVLAALASRGQSAVDHPRGKIIPDGWIDAVVVIHALQAALYSHDAVIDDMAIGLARDGQGGWRVQLAGGGAVTAARVLLANGPFAQRLVDALPAVRSTTPRLVYEAGVGMDVFVRPNQNLGRPVMPPHVVRTLGRGAIGGFHVVPLDEDHLYLGATAEAAIEPSYVAPEKKIAATYNAFLEEYDSNFVASRFQPRAIGFRALSADGFPLIGESHEKGLWFATGMRRDGFTSAPVIARLIADAMLDNAIAPALQTFTPSRALLPYKNAKQALADACAGHPQAQQEWLAEIYERRGFGDFGVNPGILPLLANDEAFGLLFNASGAD